MALVPSSTKYSTAARLNRTMPVTTPATATATAANKAREEEIRGYYDELLGRYEPGGEFGRGYLAELEQQKQRDVASGTQALISSGLYGSVGTAGLGAGWEKAVGSTARLKLEDLLTERYADVLREKAGFVERIEDASPSYETMAGLYAGAANRPRELPAMEIPTMTYSRPSTSVSYQQPRQAAQTVTQEPVWMDYGQGFYGAEGGMRAEPAEPTQPGAPRRVQPMSEAEVKTQALATYIQQPEAPYSERGYAQQTWETYQGIQATLASDYQKSLLGQAANLYAMYAL